MKMIFKNKFFIELLLIIFPISLIFSSFISEIIIILLITVYLRLCNKHEIIFSLKSPIIFIMGLIWVYLILNYLINLEKEPSITRTIFFVRFILLVISINYFVNKININLSLIFKYWYVFLLFICSDLLIQFIFLKNLLGYEASPAGGNLYRLGGMMGDELKISFFLFFFGTLVFSYFFFKNKNKLNIFFFLFFLFFSIYISGERSNFISMILFILFLFSFIKLNKKIYIVFLTLVISSLIYLGSYQKELTNRMLIELPNNFKYFKIEKNKNFFNKDSHYFSHYSTAYQMFKKNKLFGVGLKNFRNYCNEEEFKIEVHPGYIDRNCRTHPHNFYLELLSELGLTGFFMFLSFFIYVIINFIIVSLKAKNNFLLLNTFSILVFLIPILPKGSFFNNWNALIFWFIFAIVFSNFNRLVSTR